MSLHALQCITACKGLLLQAEGFAILQGAPARLQAPDSMDMTAEEDIAWEAVDNQAAPAESMPAAGDCMLRPPLLQLQLL